MDARCETRVIFSEINLFASLAGPVVGRQLQRDHHRDRCLTRDTVAIIDRDQLILCALAIRADTANSSSRKHLGLPMPMPARDNRDSRPCQPSRMNQESPIVPVPGFANYVQSYRHRRFVDRVRNYATMRDMNEQEEEVGRVHGIYSLIPPPLQLFSWL
jgi:hypothetical protein